ncbi:hypothetical protein CYMTET_50431 [Cymbomonas tetramitiformis]|uniref:Uncharacterized protein n=1 Tax=Cymbomonas tetramitiformis TaxID=36881 RepID=A0AAE0ET54_9CHLO|nr:hypothetical protein CYMTET_50431 [Cymbomonas tetramitiformis]
MTIRRIIKESDIDSGIQLSEGVMNYALLSPMLATLEVEDPGATKAEDTAEVVARRKYFSEQFDLVKKVRAARQQRKWAKSLRETSWIGGLGLPRGDKLSPLPISIVVYGGACAPSAKTHSDNFSIDECNDFDFYTL